MSTQAITPQQIAKYRMFQSGPQNPLYPPDPNAAPAPDPSQAPTPSDQGPQRGALAQAVQPNSAPTPQGSPAPATSSSAPSQSPQAAPAPSAQNALFGSQPSAPPSFDDWVQQHGHAPVQGAPPPEPEHGMLYKIMNGVGRAVGSPIAQTAANRDWNLKQQNIQYQRNLPVVQHQADEEAYNASLGQQEKGAQIGKTQAETGVIGQNLPVQEKAAGVHDELMQRWQSNVDPDENSFQQYAQQRLSSEPYAIQRMLNGDPQRGMPSKVTAITQLPRQPFSFKVADGAIQPQTYRGQNYGPQPSPNEPPEVGAARQNALASIKQGQKGKIDVATAEGKAKQQIQIGGFGQAGDPMIDDVGQGRMDLNTALSRVPPAGKAQFTKELSAKYPNYNQQTYGVAKNASEAFTSGDQGKQLTAISTAREHMKTFLQLADALDNGDVQVLNRIGNAIGVQFGSNKATNMKIAQQAFGGEVGKALDGAGVTEGERKSAQDAFNAAMSNGQFKGAAQTVDTLLAGKQRALQQSYDQSQKGRPNFGGEQGGASATHTATGPNGHKIKVVNGRWVDAQTGAPI